MNLAQILYSKPHNAHYLRRYIKFIASCEEANYHLADETYVECHHICPKANDMFPEYVDFVEHPWNMVALTARQHIIAHVMLWKAYPKAASQFTAVHYMCNVQNSDTITWNKRTVPASIYIRYAAEARNKFYESRKGFATYRDSDGNKYFIHNEDPKIKELGLVGILQGFKMNDESRMKMKRSKDPYRIVKLRFLDMRASVKLISEEFEQYLAQGWTTELTSDDVEYCKVLQYQRSSSKLSGRTEYMLPNGIYYGKLYPDDPDIIAYNLVYYMTENKLAAAKHNLIKLKEFNTGALWYNDGKISKKFKADPGCGWIKGSLHTDETKRLRAEGLRKTRSNTVVYNDGKRNFYIKCDQSVPDGLTKGMAPQKKRTITDKNCGYTIYNDGSKTYRVKHGDYVNPTWNKGMLKRSA